MNCSDFANAYRAAAQGHLHAARSDRDARDTHHDGSACESLPCPCAKASGGGSGSGGGGGPGHWIRKVRQKAHVIKVADGDMIKVRVKGKHHARRVRLIGIDTPEVYGGMECGGPQALRSMKRLLKLGIRVKLTSEPWCESRT